MNSPETPSFAPDSGLEAQITALQRQVFSMLLVLVVLTGTIVCYLFYQSRIASHDLSEFRPQAVRIIQTYRRNAQDFAGFYSQLNKYALTHPEFQPVLRKYNWQPQPAAQSR